MSWIEKIRAFFHRTPKAPAAPTPVAGPVEAAGKPDGARLKKTCRECGKAFFYDPSWEHVPNYCKECRTRFAREKEEKQRAGAPRRIKRKCKACGKFFTFPNTLAHYPNYCNDCRKRHQAEMKDKYSRKAAGKA